MNREDPQFYNVYEQPWRTQPAGQEIAHRLEGRLLSKNARTGAATYMLEVPAGWRRTLRADLETVECFVLAGDLTVNGQSVGTSGFAGIPQYTGPVKVSSQNGAFIYAFVTPDLPLPAYTTGLKVTRIWQEPWVMVDMTGVRHGLMYKSLRTPDPASGEYHGGPGGFLRMTLMTPGFMEPRHEIHHNCWEEILILRGDLLMRDRGLHADGTYLGNPAHLWHYPSATAGGCLLLIQCDAPMDVEFRDYQGGYPTLAEYLDTASWLERPEHADWQPKVELQYSQGGTAFGMASDPAPPPSASGNGSAEAPGASSPAAAEAKGA